MSLDFHPCPKCGKYELSWDGRAKAIICLYHKCRHVIKDVIYDKIPTEAEMTEAIKRDNQGSNRKVRFDDMTEKELIQAWKCNVKPFLYVGECRNDRMEMTSMAWKLGYDGGFQDLEDDWGNHFNNEHKFQNHITYRLSPSYQPKPSVIECKEYPIKPDSKGKLYFHNPVEDYIVGLITDAFNRSDFIGFKADGMIWGCLYKHKELGNFCMVISEDELDQYERVSMDEAKVLFQRSDK